MTNRVILWNTASTDMPAFAVAVLDRQAGVFSGPAVVDDGPTIASTTSTTSGGVAGIALDGPDLVVPVRQFTQADFDRGNYVVFVSDQHAIRAGQTGPGFTADGLLRVQSVTRPSGTDTAKHTEFTYGPMPGSWFLWRGAGHFNYLGEDPAEPIEPTTGTNPNRVAWQQWQGIPQAFVVLTPTSGINAGASASCKIIENKTNAYWLASNLGNPSGRSIQCWNTGQTRAVAGAVRVQAKLEWHTKRYVIDVEECDGL